MAKKEETISMIDTLAEFKELKNIDKDTMISVLEDSFRNVIAKMFGTDENYDVIINPEKGDFEIWRNRTVVADDELEDENLQLTLTEARKIDADCEVGEEVTDVSASVIVAQLLFLEAEDPEKDIHLYINSPGGSVTAGMAIYDTMKYIKCDVSTICLGMAASMGAFLLAGGTKGKRFALPHSTIMIHQPSGGAQGQATEIQIVADHIAQTKRTLNEILAENTGQPYEVVEKDTDRDNYMTAEEAKAYGLIDGVVEHK